MCKDCFWSIKSLRVIGRVKTWLHGFEYWLVIKVTNQREMPERAKTLLAVGDGTCVLNSGALLIIAYF